VGAALAGEGGTKSTAAIEASQWLLIRHAPVAGGRLNGRRSDPPCTLPPPADLAAIAEKVGAYDNIVASPAVRCAATARALFPEVSFATDERLLEQDFGDWDGRPYAEIPDLGPLPADELGRHAPPNGESFAAACARMAEGLLALPPGRNVVVAHAGTVRAALALALGSVPAALAFEVAPLSMTLLRALPGGAFSIAYVNRCG